MTTTVIVELFLAVFQHTLGRLVLIIQHFHLSILTENRILHPH